MRIAETTATATKTDDIINFFLNSYFRCNDDCLGNYQAWALKKLYVKSSWTTKHPSAIYQNQLAPRSQHNSACVNISLSFLPVFIFTIIDRNISKVIN